jgi:hypothetical protein
LLRADLTTSYPGPELESLLAAPPPFQRAR